MRFLLLPILVLAFGCSGSPSPKTATEVRLPAAILAVSTPEAAAQSAPACFDRGPGDYLDAIERLEGARGFRVHVPPSYDGRSHVPLLMNFHGQGRSAEEQDIYSSLPALSDAEGFILVSPEGGFRQWDIVGVYAEDGIDDVGAVSEILDHLTSQFCVDPGRVFATGLSNGGQMAAQVGCLLAHQFAGVAPVAGIVYQGCEGPPVAVITFHGTEDYNVPYESAPEAVIEWARYNGCPEIPESERYGEQVVRAAYFGCEGAPVVFYTLEGGGHTWPGAPDDSGGIGPTNHEINATQLIWDFFKNVRR